MKKLFILLVFIAATTVSSFAFVYQKAIYHTPNGIGNFSANISIHTWHAYLSLYASRQADNGGDDDYASATLSASSSGYYSATAVSRYTHNLWQGNIYFANTIDIISIRLMAPGAYDYASISLSW